MYTDQLVGKQVDAFTVQERIGKGGMATVYRAYQPSINRSVALKIISLDPNVGERDEFRSRFALEAQTIASLEHIHILPIYDYGIVNNEIAYIAMRMLRGGTLADMIASGPLELERTADIFTQVARGLNYAHSKGVIHRDLKPSNIMFDSEGNAYLTDFGLAKMVENSVHITKSGNIVGTPAYMSPEQLRGDPIDYRSDIYSMGCILYHLLVGHPPFEASDTNVVSVIYQHLEKDPEPPSTHNPSIPPGVEQVVLRALNKDPNERFETAEAMADALNEAMGRRVSTSSYPAVHSDSKPSVPSAIARARNQRRMYMGIGIAAILLVILLIALALMRDVGTLRVTPPTVLKDQTAVAADSQPTDDEIARAQARMGDAGFIAFVACNQSSQFHAAQAREVADFANHYSLRTRVYDSNNDKATEISQIERARTDGAVGLIVCPLDIEILSDTLRSVQQAGIPLVLMSSEVETFGGVLIAGDDFLMGLEAGRAAGEIIRDERGGHADVIILDYPDLKYLVTRADGLEAGVLETAPDVSIVGRYVGGTTDNGRQSVSDLIADGIHFDVILSINDAGAYGAIAAMEAADFDPESVIISSVDAESVARDYIRGGHFMRASVDVGRALFSQTAINTMVKLLAGATVPEIYLVPPGSVVTRETLTTRQSEQ
ncbi:MAG: protein kinase [Anaerolineae bacterium]|nr:protein kinase [Anaerolineae bacterium]